MEVEVSPEFLKAFKRESKPSEPGEGPEKLSGFDVKIELKSLAVKMQKRYLELCQVLGRIQNFSELTTQFQRAAQSGAPERPLVAEHEHQRMLLFQQRDKKLESLNIYRAVFMDILNYLRASPEAILAYTAKLDEDSKKRDEETQML
mmetsp:Transcript_42131/g.64616  ORF Transcript_42131/g.64616 Transcript_42131/m.64616 type:complete len:147 (+) Transcript_42131:161-601(+)